MLDISLFHKPDRHPYGMLRGIVSDAYEKEEFLAWMLIQCIEAGEFKPVQTRYDHSGMVAVGS